MSKLKVLILALSIVLVLAWLPELVRWTDARLGRTNPPPDTAQALAALSERLDQMDRTVSQLMAERAVELARVKSVEDLVPPDLRTAVVHAAVYNGLDPRLLAAVAWTETGGTWDSKLRGSAGEIGLMQILPSTAKGIAQERKRPIPDLTDPILNLDWGAWYLAHLLEQSAGDTSEALAAYNGGPRWRERAPTSARGYSDRVQRMATETR